MADMGAIVLGMGLCVMAYYGIDKASAKTAAKRLGNGRFRCGWRSYACTLAVFIYRFHVIYFIVILR